MIRSFEKEDLCEVLQLWLSVNLEVHSFVKESYWLEHRDTVLRCEYRDTWQR